jgi:hypothetical protein
MDLIQVLTVIGIAIANIGATISLFIWATNHAAEDRRQVHNLLKAIQDEIKDFHGRLCAIEERRGK